MLEVSSANLEITDFGAFSFAFSGVEQVVIDNFENWRAWARGTGFAPADSIALRFAHSLAILRQANGSDDAGGLAEVNLLRQLNHCDVVLGASMTINVVGMTVNL